jgi:hypothetical protein
VLADAGAAQLVGPGTATIERLAALPRPRIQFGLRTQLEHQVVQVDAFVAGSAAR